MQIVQIPLEKMSGRLDKASYNEILKKLDESMNIHHQDGQDLLLYIPTRGNRESGQQEITIPDHWESPSISLITLHVMRRLRSRPCRYYGACSLDGNLLITYTVKC